MVRFGVPKQGLLHFGVNGHFSGQLLKVPPPRIRKKAVRFHHDLVISDTHT